MENKVGKKQKTSRRFLSFLKIYSLIYSKMVCWDSFLKLTFFIYLWSELINLFCCLCLQIKPLKSHVIFQRMITLKQQCSFKIWLVSGERRFSIYCGRFMLRNYSDVSRNYIYICMRLFIGILVSSEKANINKVTYVSTTRCHG